MDLLTDLEAAAVGHVLQNQPCTAHFLRSCFKNSQLTKFSDSAGSVYPMMKRLEKRDIVKSETRQDGHRRVQYYRVTKTGRDAFQTWMGPPISNSAALSIDPLRTRIIYLRQLSPAKRRKWLDDAERLICEKKKEIQTQAKADRNNVFYQLANENALIELDARLKWVQRTRRILLNAKLISEN